MENSISKKIKRNRGRVIDSDRAFDIVNTILVSFLTLLFIYPLIYIISCSFSGGSQIFSGEVLLFPKGFTTKGYQLAFENPDIWTGYVNSIIYSVVGTVIAVSLSLMTAFPLSRKEFRARNVIMFMYVFCMYFSGGLIPTYLVVKSVGFINTIWALVIPGAVSAWNVIIIRTYYMNNIPDELYEAAEIDGYSKSGYFFKIVIPLSTPIIAVMVLFTAVGFWNSYFGAMIYLTERAKFPLQLILREILVVIQLGRFSEGLDASDLTNYRDVIQRAANLKYAVIILASFPVMIVYPFVQKYFVKGVMIGAIKS